MCTPFVCINTALWSIASMCGGLNPPLCQTTLYMSDMHLPWCAPVTAAWLVDKHMVYYYNNAINGETFSYKLLALLIYHGDVIACFCINFALLAHSDVCPQSHARFHCWSVSYTIYRLHNVYISARCWFLVLLSFSFLLYSGNGLRVYIWLFPNNHI